LHWGVALFFLVAAPWFYWVAEATGGRWLADFIYLHHFQRYTAGAGHRQPFYYYLTTLPADFLPWTIFLLPALAAYRPWRARWAEPAAQFFILWFGSVFLFFALVALAGLGAAPAAWFIQRDALAPALAAGAPLVLGGGAALWCVGRGRPLAAAGAVAGMMALAVLGAALWIMPYLENFKSPRSLAARVNEIVPASAPVYIYADTMNDFNFYAAREVMPVLAAPAALDALLARGGHEYLLIKERDLRRLPQLAQSAIIASEARSSATWH